VREWRRPARRIDDAHRKVTQLDGSVTFAGQASSAFSEYA